MERSVLDVTEGAACWQTYLEQAKQAGRGIIFVSAHFGNWDMAAAILARHIAFSAIVETFADTRLNTLIQNQRKEKSIDIIPMEGSPRRILRVLQQNQLVGLLVDRPVTPQQGTPVQVLWPHHLRAERSRRAGIEKWRSYPARLCLVWSAQPTVVTRLPTYFSAIKWRP